MLKQKLSFILLLIFWFNFLYAQNQEVVFLQINDTYEIAPLANGAEGGMARVATLFKQLKQQNPNSFFIHAGDFLNPSVLGVLKHEGKRIKGKQMVEVMNTMGIDYVTFGNHEFDLELSDLQERLNESKFTWVCTNLKQRTEEGVIPFYSQQQPLPTYKIIKAGNLKIGVLGLTLFTDKHYLFVENLLQRAKETYNLIKDSTDFVVAITHQNIEDDRILAQELPDLKLIMGGHEHDNMAETIGSVAIRKADANVKTAYIHRLTYNSQTKQVTLKSELKKIDPTLTDDEKTAVAVQKWLVIADMSLKNMGFDPEEVLMTTTEPLNGLESQVRTTSTNLSRIVGKAFKEAVPNSVAVVYNGGSIRIDDKLNGKITQYDVVRILPFGGGLIEIKITGNLLHKILDTGLANRGKGGWLHTEGVERKGKKWKIGGKKLRTHEHYQIAIPEFLLTGGETNMEWLTEKNPEIIQIIKPDPKKTEDLRNDVRKALVTYMRKIGK